jgi:non-ribosomal peptide synthase protein (TIGR01720 family)
MYRTGDRARWLHDGSLEFLGRLDQQIKVRGYRVEPGEIEAALVEHPEVREAVVASRRDMVGDSLVAFVAAATGPDESALRQFLLARLPQHLVPSRIVVLRELPRLPGGKIDRQTLMATQQFLSLPARATVLPRNEVERALAEIWAAVLGLRDVGMDDNFFEIGGDSIKGIQVVARAAAAGWRITPKDLFQHQTIAQLAPHAIRDGKPTAEQGSVTGSAPLTPIQCEFFAHDLADAHHFNQAVLLEIKPAFGPALLEQAARHIVAHHDALRHRFTRAADGCWQQTVVPNDPRPWLEQVDLSAVADTELARALAEAIETAQASVHLTEGPLARFVHFHLGPRRLPRLVIIVHHLVVDAVSWRALLEDFASACLQLATGREVALPPKTTSFLDWARRLPGLAATDAVRRQTEFWTRPTRCAPLPRDHRHGENLVAAEDHVEVALSAEETARWLHDAQLAFRTRPHELLVAALADTLCAYTGQVEIHIDMEGHGREALFDGVDLSRTVGWFTALYPLALTLPQQRRPDDLIKSIKEQLRAVPTGGVGFGLLRWLAPDAALRARLAEVARGEVSFNYLGQLDDLVPADAPFSLFWQQPGLARSLRARRPHVWEVVAYVRGGCLRVRWQFATTLHRRDTVCALAERCLMVLRELIAYCLEPGVSGATPSDFPLAALDQGDLDRLAEMLDAQ